MAKSQVGGDVCGKRLLTIDDIHAEFGLSVWTVRDIIKRGVLPGVRLPGVRKVFVDRHDLEAFIEANKATDWPEEWWREDG